MPVHLDRANTPSRRSGRSPYSRRGYSIIPEPYGTPDDSWMSFQRQALGD